jgi:glycosyltransferase involved in cell wall biosynthesis
VTGLPTSVADLGASGTFCFISEALRAEAEADSPWTYPSSTVTYSGIDTALFTSDAARARNAWQWRLLYVGRIDRRKGIETVIRALVELPPAARLDIDGRGGAAERARLEEIATELGVAERVRFTESARAALPELYRTADVVVFPPIWDEPFGLVPLEAMACGTPVVATGTGGSAEFLRDGHNCLLFPKGDHAALAAALRRLADDRSLRDRLVAGGARTARELDVDRLAGVLEAWHVAAADGYASGMPPHRPRPAQSAA